MKIEGICGSTALDLKGSCSSPRLEKMRGFTASTLTSGKERQWPVEIKNMANVFAFTSSRFLSSALSTVFFFFDFGALSKCLTRDQSAQQRVELLKEIEPAMDHFLELRESHDRSALCVVWSRTFDQLSRGAQNVLIREDIRTRTRAALGKKATEEEIKQFIDQGMEDPKTREASLSFIRNLNIHEESGMISSKSIDPADDCELLAMMESAANRLRK